MTSIIEHKKIALFLLLTAVVGISAFTLSSNLANAEESTDEQVEDGTEVTEDSKRAEMKKQIESLRAAIAERKASFSVAKEEYKEERKAEFKVNKEEFMASLEGLSEEEKRAAMMQFISDIKAELELKKATYTEKKTEFKEQHAEAKDEFKASLEGQSPQEKIALILERVAAIKKQIEERMKDESDDSEGGAEDEDESEDEDSDETEDEDDSTIE